MDNLQSDFLADGIDAYNKFIKFGVDGLTDNNGNPTFNKKQGDGPIKLQFEGAEEVVAPALRE